MESETRILDIMATIPIFGEPGVGQYKWRRKTAPCFSPIRQGPYVYPVGTKPAALPCCLICPDTQGGRPYVSRNRAGDHIENSKSTGACSRMELPLTLKRRSVTGETGPQEGLCSWHRNKLLERLSPTEGRLSMSLG